MARFIPSICGATALLASFSVLACGVRSEPFPGLLGQQARVDEDEGDPPPPAEQEEDEEEEDEEPRERDPRPFGPPLRCSDLSLNYSPTPATVLLLVDRSGSMEFEFGGQPRWALVREALFGEPNGLVTELGDSARFGLAFYSSLDGFDGGQCPMMDYSPIVLGEADLLRAIFDGTAPLLNGDTPTGEALDEAVDALVDDGAPGPRYLVLITDGEPDTCAVPDPQNGQGQALAAAERAFNFGINTFVVGVSPDIGGSHLQEMSNVAQGVRPEARWGVDADAIQPIEASSQHEVLADQIQGALGDVRSCSIPLDEDVDFEGVFQITLDETTLFAGTDYIVEDERLELLDEACDEVLSDAETLEVTVPCVDR